MDGNTSSDKELKSTGTISFINNRILWKIPGFHRLKKNCWFGSPRFFSMGSYWQLHFCYFQSILSYKEWLEINVKRLADIFPCEKKIIRFGILGRSLEISETLEKYGLSNSVPVILSSNLKNEKDEWIIQGNLCLFFSVEEDSNAPRNHTAKKKIAASGGSERMHQNVCDAVSTQVGKEVGVGKLQQDLGDILENGFITDVILNVDGQEFKSHRCILAARSPVFLSMMMHDTKEKNTGVVDIQDIDANTFLDFLKYLYTGRSENITSGNAPRLYTVADKYQVYELKQACTNYMLENISVDNFCDFFALSLLHVEKDLTDACSQFFIKNSLGIVKTVQWQIFLSEYPTVCNELYIKQLEVK